VDKVKWLSSRSLCCIGGQVDDDDTGNMFLHLVNWMSIKAKAITFNFHVLNNTCNVFPIKIISVAYNWVFSFQFLQHLSFYNRLLKKYGTLFDLKKPVFFYNSK